MPIYFLSYYKLHILKEFAPLGVFFTTSILYFPLQEATSPGDATIQKLREGDKKGKVCQSRDIYSGYSGNFLSQLKNREEFEGGLEKRKGKEENKERVIKHTLKYLYEA